MVNLLNFMVWNSYFLIMYRISLPSSLFLTFGGQCLSYPWCKYGEIPLRSPQKLSYTYWKFCSTSLSLYPLVGAWWWSAPSLTQNLPCIWVQGQYHPWGEISSPSYPYGWEESCHPHHQQSVQVYDTCHNPTAISSHSGCTLSTPQASHPFREIQQHIHHA